MKNILQRLMNETPKGQESAVPFTTVDVNKHLQSVSSSYSNVISRSSAQPSQSNVFDIKTGTQIQASNQVQLGNLDHVDPSLFDDKRLTLAPGQEPTANQGPGFSI